MTGSGVMLFRWACWLGSGGRSMGGGRLWVEVLFLDGEISKDGDLSGGWGYRQ
jgi:hypothetical protein